jgi:spermidine/putrescine transport system ATP-binding protein
VAGHELLVALPQNRAFDHIRPGEVITLGWHPQSGIAFARTEDLP